MGTVVIIPPEGDMQHYLDTLRRLQSLDIAEIVPAHGPIITDPQAKIAEYIAHRLDREQQVRPDLTAADRTIPWESPSNSVATGNISSAANGSATIMRVQNCASAVL